jgi:hypothetical protein
MPSSAATGPINGARPVQRHQQGELTVGEPERAQRSSKRRASARARALRVQDRQVVADPQGRLVRHGDRL